MKILDQALDDELILSVYRLCPLPILKQMITMFFSVNSHPLRKGHEQLVRFVLNKEQKFLEPKYRFFTFYTKTRQFRFWGMTGRLNTFTGKKCTYSEIVFPPFGYVMSFGSGPPDPRLSEITHFSRYSYSDCVEMELGIPVLPTHLAYPGDYRTKHEIESDRESNLREMVLRRIFAPTR